MLAPESTGRASGRRPSGFRGWSSGKRSSVVFSDGLRGGPAQVPLSRDEALAAQDRRTRQVRAEIARMVRRASQLSARRGPPSERVKNPRSEGFWKTVHAERLNFVETVLKAANHPGEARALRTLPIRSASRRVRMRPLAPTWRLRRLSAPVGGGASRFRLFPLWGKTIAKRPVGDKCHVPRGLARVVGGAAAGSSGQTCRG